MRLIYGCGLYTGKYGNYFSVVQFPPESRILIGWRAVWFSPYGPRNRTALLVEQVLSKQVFLFIFSKNVAVIITPEWIRKGFTAKVSFIYILKSKTNMVCLFFPIRDIKLSINFSYIAERWPAFFTNWKFLLILRGKNKFVIHWPGSVQISKNCALSLENCSPRPFSRPRAPFRR